MYGKIYLKPYVYVKAIDFFLLVANSISAHEIRIFTTLKRKLLENTSEIECWHSSGHCGE